MAEELKKELLELGLADAHVDEHGYVYATLPANTDKKAPAYLLFEPTTGAIKELGAISIEKK